tara:strand:+ start:127 stop:474 length:348 start_codon:yes stop_codon:yes gene_type:complete
MSGIIHGRLTASSGDSDVVIDGKLLSRKAVHFTELPAPIRYLLLEVPAGNSGSVYIGGVEVSSDNAPAISRGTTKEFTFKHDVNELPVDLSDFYANFGHNGDVINYLAITIKKGE